MLGLEVFVCSGDWKNNTRSEVRMSKERVQGEGRECEILSGRGGVTGRKGQSELRVRRGEDEGGRWMGNGRWGW